MDVATSVLILMVGLVLGAGLAFVLIRSQLSELRERLREKEAEASEVLRDNRRLEREEAVVETERKAAVREAGPTGRGGKEPGRHLQGTLGGSAQKQQPVFLGAGKILIRKDPGECEGRFGAA